MNYNSGFYKKDNDILLFGPNDISGLGYNLHPENHDQYEYPTDGWYWFDSLEEACLFFDINIDDYQQSDKEGIPV